MVFLFRDAFLMYEKQLKEKNKMVEDVINTPERNKPWCLSYF